jgi:hypothetical protein
VNQLFIPGAKTWNLDLLHELFNEHDIQAITTIPIPVSGTEDCVAWHPKKNGTFSVKSAYQLDLAWKQQATACSSSSAPNGKQSIWNLIWKVEVQPKVRVFMWR